jgi:hypothetical protein
MTVDFEFKKAPAYRVAALPWKGPWSDASVRAHFEKVRKWAVARPVRTGKWIVREPGEPTFEVSIEVASRCCSGKGSESRRSHVRPWLARSTIRRSSSPASSITA